MSRLPWKMRYSPSPGPVLVLDAQETPVARCEHPVRARAAADAILLAHAPVLLGIVANCAEVFQVMSEHDPGPSGMVARDMFKQLDEVLRGPVSVWEDESGPPLP